MPMKPRPFKMKCPKCSYSKIIQLSRDTLDVTDMIEISKKCPYCSVKMERVEMNLFDKIFNIKFKKSF